jgi:type I restriction enzyme R subunit
MVRARGRDEADTCRDVVLPGLAAAGWPDAAVRPEYVVNERLARLAGDRRRLGDGRVDYLLEAVPGVPTAVVEAKREHLRAQDGMQQAIRYAQQLDVPLAYATNGRQIIERDMVTGVEREVESVATPAESWSAWQAMHGLTGDDAELVKQPFNRRKLTAHNDVVEPRYYQRVAIHRVLRALATGERRVLLLMATGTGKTFTAMQIVHKLRAHHAAMHPDTNHRTLYLADRDALLSQPMAKDFAPAFGREPLKRILDEHDRSRELYFGTYQALANEDAFIQIDPDFFDLVVVDECHRGSASEESSWRRVLDHFSGAAQLGLTATPIRDDTIDSYAYFGNPVFEYSLRDGIEDGYLAPYRVRRVVLSPDADGWEPGEGQLDRFGREIPEGLYGTRDFERVVSLLARTMLAVRHLSELLRRDPDPGARALVFCVDVEHADDVRRELVHQNPDRVAAEPE